LNVEQTGIDTPEDNIVKGIMKADKGREEFGGCAVFDGDIAQ